MEYLEYMTLRECSVYLRCSQGKIRKYITDEKNPLPYIRTSERGKFLFSKSVVDAWLTNFVKG